MSASLHVEVKPEQDPTVEAVVELRDCPPVLILNMFHSGLGIARSLAGKGVRVIGLSADRKTYGNFTRHCKVMIAPNSQDAPKELLRFLLRVSNDFPGAVIFPTRDVDVLFLDGFRSELSMYRLAIPPTHALRRTIDKYELALAASAAGVPTPATIYVDSVRELDRVAKEIGFPCVLKPVSAFHWRVGDTWQRFGARKAVLIETEATLRSEYAHISQVTPRVLVQTWIPGDDERIVVLGGYADRNSTLSSYFTARKILQSPAGCGTGCIVQSEPIPAIVGLSEKLLKCLQYQGMAEIEYKFDAATGEYKLIEINTRHWDQHQLGQASGINLSWVAYCDLTGRPAPPFQDRIVNAKWIAEDALIMYSLRALYRRQIGLKDLWRKLSGQRMYSILAWNDPMPSLRYGVSVFLPELARSIFRKSCQGRVS